MKPTILSLFLACTALLVATPGAALDDVAREADEVEEHEVLRSLEGRADVDAPPGDAEEPSPLADEVADRQPLLKWGLHPDASDALRRVGISSDRIMQTIGGAPDSKGTHLQDGTVAGQPYSAATDISVRNWSQRKIRSVLEELGKEGFAAWYRQPGSDHWPSTSAPHIHAVYVGCKMKPILRRQVNAWLEGRNGLRSNAPYRFYKWSGPAKSKVRSLFRAHGGGTR